MRYNIKAVQRWRSGRTRTIRNRVMQECIQGFKSLSLRHKKRYTFGYISFCLCIERLAGNLEVSRVHARSEQARMIFPSPRPSEQRRFVATQQNIVLRTIIMKEICGREPFCESKTLYTISTFGCKKKATRIIVAFLLFFTKSRSQFLSISKSLP